MSIDLDSLSGLVRRPDDEARGRMGRLLPEITGSTGSLGRLEELACWLAGVQGSAPLTPIERPRVVLFAGDHGVARAGVSARPLGDTVRSAREAATGGGTVGVLARLTGAGVRVVDLSVDAPEDALGPEVSRYRVRRGSEAVDRAAATTREQGETAFATGMELADREIDDGADLLLVGDINVGGTTVAAVLVGALTGCDAATVIGRGSGIDDATWIVKCAAIRDALRRARPVLGDPLTLLATSGGADVTAMAGFLLRAAVRRTPVVLDSVLTAAAALVVQRIAYQAADWWLAGHLTPEPAHARALDRLALTPLLDYRVRHGEATGSLLALPLLRAASALGSGACCGAEAASSTSPWRKTEARVGDGVTDATARRE